MKKHLLVIAYIFLFGCGQSKQTEEVNNFDQAPIQKDTSAAIVAVEPEQPAIIVESQDTVRCNIDYVATIKRNLDNLDTSMVSNLLRAIDWKCQNNVEFSQFSNAMLYKVIEKRIDLFCLSYQNNVDDIDTSYILSNLRYPIHDLIPLDSIIKMMEQVDEDFIYKQEILSNIKQGYLE